MEQAYTIIGVGVVIFLSYFFSRFFEKTNIPDVLPLFLLGIYIGPIAGLVSPGDIHPFVDIFAVFTITSILFVGGLKIDFVSLVRSFPRAVTLMLLNLVATIVLVSAAAHLFFDIPLLLGAIVGVLVGGTSSAVVIPVANALRITSDTKTMLAVESNLNVIFSVVLAYSMWRIWEGDVISFSSIAANMGAMFLFSVFIGFITAVLWSRLMPLTRYLQNNLFTTPAFLLIVYGLAEVLGANGTLTVLAFGITLGNLQNLYWSSSQILKTFGQFSVSRHEELFFTSLMFVFKTFFFVYMGVVISLGDIALLLWGAAIMCLLYLIRMLIAHVLLSRKIPDLDLLVVKAMLPKGLVAGAILAIIGDPQLEALAYPIILMSIIGTSIAIFIVQREIAKTDVRETEHMQSKIEPIHTRLLSD